MGKGPEFLHFGGVGVKMSNGVLLELLWGNLQDSAKYTPDDLIERTHPWFANRPHDMLSK